MICPNCRTQNKPGARFCEECGTPLPAEHLPSYTQQSFDGVKPPQMSSGAAPQPPHPQMTYTDTPGAPYGGADQPPYGGAGQIPPGTPYGGGGRIPPGTSYGSPPQTSYGGIPQEPAKKKRSGLVIAVVLAVITLLAVLIVAGLFLTGIIGGGDSGETAADTSTRERTRHTTEQTATSEASTEASTEATVPGTEVSAKQLDVTVIRNVLEVTLDTGDGERVIDTITYDLVEADASAPEALKEALDEFNSYIEAYCNDYPVDNGPELYEWFADPDGFGGDIPYSETVTLDVRRADEAVFSVSMADDSYMGGVHPYLEYTGFSFDARNGEQLFLSDVVADTDALAAYAYEEMRKDTRLKRVDDALVSGGEESLLELTRSYLSDDMLAFALTNEGIVLLFSDYMLGSYATGSAEIHVPYRGNEDAFVAQYMESADPADDVTRHVQMKAGKETSRDLVELCEEAGIDVTQGITQGTCSGTYYINGDEGLAHITFGEGNTYTAYYAHGGIESAGTCEWNDESGYGFESTGILTDASGNVFAEAHYYPFADMLEINANFYMK